MNGWLDGWRLRKAHSAGTWDDERMITWGSPLGPSTTHPLIHSSQPSNQRPRLTLSPKSPLHRYITVKGWGFFKNIRYM